MLVLPSGERDALACGASSATAWKLRGTLPLEIELPFIKPRHRHLKNPLSQSRLSCPVATVILEWDLDLILDFILTTKLSTITAQLSSAQLSTALGSLSGG